MSVILEKYHGQCGVGKVVKLYESWSKDELDSDSCNDSPSETFP